ncbi:MAG: hypothetical protein APF81_01275 [Desulfosporosinus sp. BRH_c37]|nr:MAG: hypothetical protein APF81_01275 [Desulfosporosinus sp. BRH_c37]
MKKEEALAIMNCNKISQWLFYLENNVTLMGQDEYTKNLFALKYLNIELISLIALFDDFFRRFPKEAGDTDGITVACTHTVSRSFLRIPSVFMKIRRVESKGLL